MTVSALLRSSLALLGSVVASYFVANWPIGETQAFLLPAALLAVAGLLSFHQHVASQLFVRATLWSNVLMFFAVSLSISGSEQISAASVVLGAASALMVLGTSGLQAKTGAAFQPVAFRASIMAGLVISMAMAQWFFFFSGAALSDPGDLGPVQWAFPATCGFIALAVLGLYRMKVWGLMLKIVVDVGFLGLAGFVLYMEPHVVSGSMFALGLLQVVLTAPLVAACIRGLPSGAGRSHSGFGNVLASLGLMGAMGLSAYGAFVVGGPVF